MQTMHQIQAAGAVAPGLGSTRPAQDVEKRQAGFCLCNCTDADSAPAPRQAGFCLCMCTDGDAAPAPRQAGFCLCICTGGDQTPAVKADGATTHTVA